MQAFGIMGFSGLMGLILILICCVFAGPMAAQFFIVKSIKNDEDRDKSINKLFASQGVFTAIVCCCCCICIILLIIAIVGGTRMRG